VFIFVTIPAHRAHSRSNKNKGERCCANLKFPLYYTAPAYCWGMNSI